MESVDKLKPRRKALVIAAEQAAEAMFKGQQKRPKKTQLNRLIAVCGEASCAEEIDNYLRYQASRENTGWTSASELVISSVAEHLADLKDDELKVAAYRLYAVFLARAFTYRDKVAQPQRAKGDGANTRRRS